MWFSTQDVSYIMRFHAIVFMRLLSQCVRVYADF